MSIDRTMSATDVQQVRRVTWAGLVLNVILSGAKIAAGVVGHSQAVLADGVHSLSDTSTDVAILLGVHYWSKPPDREHPHGHRRIETLVTFAIALVLVAVSVGLARSAIAALRSPVAASPSWVALAAALLSIISKEGLFRWTLAVGKRIQSSALTANAWHHRSDALSSLPVALAIIAAKLHAGWGAVDHLAALVVCIFVFRAGVILAMPALRELMDAGASEKEVEKIHRIALGIDGVLDVHAIRTRRTGSALVSDLHVLVDGRMSVRAGHEVAEEVKQRLLERGPRLADVVVHIEPYETDGQDHLD